MVLPFGGCDGILGSNKVFNGCWSSIFLCKCYMSVPFLQPPHLPQAPQISSQPLPPALLSWPFHPGTGLGKEGSGVVLSLHLVLAWRAKVRSAPTLGSFHFPLCPAVGSMGIKMTKIGRISGGSLALAQDPTH